MTTRCRAASIPLQPLTPSGPPCTNLTLNTLLLPPRPTQSSFWYLLWSAVESKEEQGMQVSLYSKVYLS